MAGRCGGMVGAAGGPTAESGDSGQGAAVLLLVDGHAYAYRSFHAIRALSAPDGSPTNAIYGFIKTVEKLRARLNPTHGVVAWDGGLASERLRLLPEYKAQRPPMPPALAAQLSAIQGWLEAAGWASHCQDGVEADDWIATLARHAVAEGARVIIASSDKDFMQLVGPAIGLVNPNDKAEVTWGPAEVRAKAGVEPRQIVDWLSLVGDSVDNIPGVAGVGPKTAATLLERYGSCTDLLRRLGEVESDRLRGVLNDAGPVLERNRQMIRLKDDLPGAGGLEGWAFRPPDLPRLRTLYRGWGFASLLRALGEEGREQPELF